MPAQNPRPAKDNAGSAQRESGGVHRLAERRVPAVDLLTGRHPWQPRSLRLQGGRS